MVDFDDSDSPLVGVLACGVLWVVGVAALWAGPSLPTMIGSVLAASVIAVLVVDGRAGAAVRRLFAAYLHALTRVSRRHPPPLRRRIRAESRIDPRVRFRVCRTALPRAPSVGASPAR